MALGGSIGSATIGIGADTSLLQRSIERGLGGAFKKAAALASAAFAGAAAGNFFKDAINQSSDLNESLNAIRVTLGKGADSFIEFGKTAADRLGLTQAALNEAVVPMAALLNNAGIEGQNLSNGLQTLAQRATDVGSVFNTDINDVLEAFGAAMRGEQEPIRRFGVNLNEAGIAAEAVRLGLAKSATEVTQAAKTQAAYSLILKDTEKAAGDFNNTQNTWANLMRRVGAATDEAKASLGTALLPTVTDLANKLLPFIQQAGPGLAQFGQGLADAGTQAVTFFQDQVIPGIQPVKDAIVQLVQTAIDAGPGLANLGQAIWDATAPLRDLAQNIWPALFAAIGLVVTALSELGTFLSQHETLVTAIGVAITTVVLGMAAWKAAVVIQTTVMAIATVVTTGWVGAFWALNAAMTANPIGLIVVALGALVAGFVLAWQHSETFREIVVATINGIKDAMVTGVSIIWKVWTAWIRGVLEAIKGMAGLWSKLPKILGGGDNGWAAKIQNAADTVLSALSAVQNGIDSLHDKDIHINVITTYLTQRDDSDQLAAQKAQQREAMASGATAAGRARKVAVQSVPTPAPMKFGGAGSFDAGKEKKAAADAAKKAADAAKKAAQKARDAADKAAGKQVSARTFVDTITGGQDQIKAAFDKLLEQIKAGNKPKLAAYVKSVQKDLLAVGVKRDKISESLTLAKDKLRELRKESADYSKSVRDAILETGNIATHNVITFTGIRNSLRHAVRQATEFKAAIASLTAAGLNKDSLQDLIAAGPEAGLKAARTLMQGGAAGIKEVNSLTAQLTAAGTAMGDQTAATFYKAGISAAEGLVKGLQSQEAALNKQMDRMASRMVTTLRRQLGIHSPSRVFAGIGGNIGAGLARGIDASRGRVGAAAGRMGMTTINHFGGISVSGLADPVQMERGGIMTAHAIADTLARQQATANLAGMG